MNSLQTQEQRRMLRQEPPNIEGILLAKSQPSYKTKKKGWKNEKKSDEDDNDEKEKYSICQYYKKNFSSTLEMLVETRCGVQILQSKGSCREGMQKKATRGANCSRD